MVFLWLLSSGGDSFFYQAPWVQSLDEGCYCNVPLNIPCIHYRNRNNTCNDKSHNRISVVFSQLIIFVQACSFRFLCLLEVTQSHNLTRYHECIFAFHYFGTRNERNLYSIWWQELGERNDGLMYVRVFTIRWYNLGVRNPLLRTNHADDYNIKITVYCLHPA